MRARSIIFLIALLAGCDADRDLARMVAQPRAQAFRAGDMRAPPVDTVSREAPEGEPALVDGRERGAYVERFPLPLTRALLERGRDRYDIYCAACHGVLGDSDTPVAAHMHERRPPSLVSAEVRAMPPGRVYGAIAHGYGLMPALGGVLSLEERWAVAAYVRALGEAAPRRVDDLPPDIVEEARRALR